MSTNTSDDLRKELLQREAVGDVHEGSTFVKKDQYYCFIDHVWKDLW